MTRDEVKKAISEAIDAAFPENVDLDADDLDTVDTTVSELTSQISDASDAVDQEEDSEVEKT